MEPGVVNILQKYRIGELDQRVQILSPTETQSSTSGEVTQTWGEYATRYAAVTPLGGSEPIISDMIQPASRAKFIFRYDANITEKCRLVWHAKTFAITSIEVIPRNRFLIIIGESNSLSGEISVDYGDFYSTNSLRIRQITASAITTVTPTQAQITSDVGLTPTQARAGYIAMVYIAALNRTILVTTNGTYWFFSYVTT